MRLVAAVAVSIAIAGSSSMPSAARTLSTNPTGTGAAAPAFVAPGDVSLLTVLVTPGADPTSTGLAVTANLTSIGGAAAQPFFDDGTNGDLAAGDNVFSCQATIAASASDGAKTLAVNITDAQTRGGTTSITLSVAAVLAIHSIQGSQGISPWEDRLVSTTGIVTAVKTNGFFIQSPDAAADADAMTSEGLFVVTTPDPAVAVVGSLVRVVGTVDEVAQCHGYYGACGTAANHLTVVTGMPLGGGAVANPIVTVLASGNPLPAPITLTAAHLSPGGDVEDLEPYEGMRVRVESLTVVGPTGARGTEGGLVSDGVFYGVITGTARPFREPGGDPLAWGGPLAPAVWFDGNLERLGVDSAALGVSPLDVATGAVVMGLVGPLDSVDGMFTIDLEATPAVAGGVSPAAVPAASPDQFTVASFNLRHFFDSGDQTFEDRLSKASLVIRNYLRMPDIIGVQEVDTLPTLQKLATKVNADAGALSPGYTPYLVGGNDPSGSDTGILVKSTVSVSSVTQEGKDETFVDGNGQVRPVNERPPLVLRGSVPNPSGPAFPLTVVVNDVKSRAAVDGDALGWDARIPRRLEAEFLANILQRLQTNGERVISVGGYSSFQFTDGWVDVMGTAVGNPGSALFTSPDLVEPNFTNLIDLVVPSEQYNYVESGNAETLDHILVSSTAVPWAAHLAYARVNADFPAVYGANAARPESVSDHDPVVAYFDLQTGTLAPPVITSVNHTSFTSNVAGSFTVTATGYPRAGFSVTGTLPNGVTFNPLTGILAGTPTGLGQNGLPVTYPLTFTAANGVAPAAHQNFTLVVEPDPRAPGAFGKLAPANGASFDASTSIVTLSWQPSANADGYYVQGVGEHGGAVWVDGTSYGFAVHRCRTYQWQVEAYRTDLTGGFRTSADAGQSWTFTTRGCAPGPFGKTGPGDGVTGLPTTVTLTWGASADATEYRYCLGGRDPMSGQCVGDYVSVGNHTSVSVDGLRPGTRYHWQVQAYNDLLQRASADGEYSTWSFTTAQLPVPAVFSKISPSDASILPGSPILRWGASTGATAYQYCYDTTNDNACSTWVDAGTATEVTPGGLAPATTYYWQVKAINAAGTTYATGGGTLYWSFTTEGAPSLPAGDFDGDGQADAAVFLTGRAEWYIRRSGTGEGIGLVWGTAGDIPVPADYDGDGRADVAVFRPSSGAWYIVKSGGGLTGLTWGAPGDLPVPADYDGDGKTDIAVFRPSDGGWYIANSSAAAIGLPWGMAGDAPVPADYDGDGRADIAVFRPSQGAWYVVKSSGGGKGFHWGATTGRPMASDVDGDGQADPVVIDAHVWNILKSTTGIGTALQWGENIDVPVSGDFDGDGKADLAFFRPSDGGWYVSKSSGGSMTLAWGTVGELPV